MEGVRELVEEALPDEMWVAVFAYLEPIHTAAVTLTCRRWRALFHSDPPLWQRFHRQLLGTEAPLVPALVSAPRDEQGYASSGPKTMRSLYKKCLRQMRQEARFAEDEWRAALEWKVRRVHEWGVTPAGMLEWAALLGCPRLVATILRRHWHELTTTGGFQRAITNALRAAVCANELESAKMLLERGADPSGMRAEDNPRREAVRWGNLEMLLLLERRGGTYGNQMVVLEACSAGHVHIVAHLLESPVHNDYLLTQQPDGGDNPKFGLIPDIENLSGLCRAARKGHLDIVKLFRPHFARRVSKQQQSNALWSAAKGGHDDVIEYLLESGAVPISPQPITTYAQQPNPNPTILIRLIKLVADRPLWWQGTTSWQVFTAPHLDREGRMRVYKMMQARGANIDDTILREGEPRGHISPLAYAVYHTELEMAECLLECGADARQRFAWAYHEDADDARRQMEKLLAKYATEKNLVVGKRKEQEMAKAGDNNNEEKKGMSTTESKKQSTPKRQRSED